MELVLWHLISTNPSQEKHESMKLQVNSATILLYNVIKKNIQQKTLKLIEIASHYVEYSIAKAKNFNFQRRAEVFMKRRSQID